MGRGRRQVHELVAISSFLDDDVEAAEELQWQDRALCAQTDP